MLQSVTANTKGISWMVPMNELETAQKEVALTGDIARCHYGQPNYPFLKREWLDAVDRVNRIVDRNRAKQEVERQKREENWRK